MGYYDDFLTRYIKKTEKKKPELAGLLDRLQKMMRISEYELAANTYRGIAEYACKHIVNRYATRFQEEDLTDLFHVLKTIEDKQLAPEKIVDSLFALRMENKGSHQGDKVTGHDIVKIMPLLPGVLDYLTAKYPQEIDTDGRFADIANAARTAGRGSVAPVPTYLKKLVLLALLVGAVIVALRYGKLFVYKAAEVIGVAEALEEKAPEFVEEAKQQAVTETTADETKDGNAEPAELLADQSAEGMRKLSVASADASSALAGEIVYTADRCLDGDLSTNWQEGVEGYGEGSTLTFCFDAKTEVQYIRIRGGSAVDEERYSGNGRPCDIRIQAGKKVWTVRLDDVNAFQMIRLPESVKTAEITLTIDTVYTGNKWQDTAVSEVEFYAPDA